ncbi:hypothetical protein HPG69_004235 [Diceros bicornis minor]|uniref:KASH5-like coiled-coil domain-containing protein n=1 Tax=Diceros bicornis minor TaxID=77932 RepID=A0A7J7EA49_DICBM|nr:hypothetical protein HPG69_004235 [Diceros bicornis minor]
MASAGKVTEKRHNPVESICRKIRAIQKREEVSNPVRQIIKYQSSSFDSPQTNAKKEFEEVLKKMAAAYIPTPNTHFSSSEKDNVFISSPQIESPRTSSISHLSSPENATYSVILTSSENISRPRSQNYTSLISQIRKGGLFSNKDLNNYCSENSFSTLTLDFDFTSDQSSELFTPQDSVVKKLSLNEDGWKLGTNDGKEHVNYSINRTCEEEFFTSIIHACDAKCRAKMMADITESASGSFEALGGDMSKGVLEVSGLITYITDLHFNKQKLEEENNKFKLALETLEEANSQLSEDCTELRLQIKSARQAIMRTNLLKEELEELKISMDASEEQKTMIVAQNKQLKTENRALILKIRILQEEMQLHTYENSLLSKDASLRKKDLSIEELKSTIIEYGSIIENLRGDKNKLALELQHLQQELIMQKQLEAIKQLREDAVNQEAHLREKVQEASQRLEDTEEQVEDRDRAAHGASEKAKSLPHKLEEAILEQRNLQAINTELVNSCQILEQKTRKLKNRFQQPLQEQLKQCYHKRYSGQEARIHQTPLTFKHTCWYTPLLDALHLDSLTAIPRLELTPFSYVANGIHASCERLKYGEIDDGALDVTRRHNSQEPVCLLWIIPPILTIPFPVYENICLKQPLWNGKRQIVELVSFFFFLKENDVERSYSESPPQSREYSTLPSPGHTSSTESTVTSSVCFLFLIGNSPAPENIALQGSASEDKTMLNLEAKEEPETMDKHKKECAAGDTAISSLPVTNVKSVNFRQSDSTSANEKEVEAEFLRLSLGFKCDLFTLEKRVRLEERSRDLAEENLKKEITNCLKLLESLTPLCEDDNQAQEIIKKLEKTITFLSQCTARVASRAEMLGAINQESRVSKAVEVMIQHVENLKRMYAKEHAELEELKQVLLQNERSFNPLEDEDDCQIKKRSASLNSKPSSLRRVTIASLPRNIGNAGMMAGIENNDRFSRRSSSWRILGSKQSEHRPSLHRFISTYSWADAEEEKCELKTKDDSETPGEEIVERTRKPSLSEKRNNPPKWDVSSV